MSAGDSSSAQTATSSDTGDIKLKAEAGDPAAQETYAVRLEAGRYYVEAAKWFRRAADAGRAESQFRLGAMLLKGFPAAGSGRPALHAQPLAAIGLLTKAAEQGHDRAQLELGRCLYAGIGVSPSPVEAYRWLLLAAESNPAARAERDRVALTLSTGQIQKAQERARAFRAGDRSDPRIRIVTQADLETDKVSPKIPAPVETPSSSDGGVLVRTNAPILSTTEVVGSVTNAESIATGTDKRTSNRDVAGWLSGLFSKNGNKTAFARVRRLIMPLALLGGVAVVGLIGFMVIVGRSQRRRTAAKTPVAVDSPAAPPPIDRRITRPSPPRELEYLRAVDLPELVRIGERVLAHDGYQVAPVDGTTRNTGIDLAMSRGGIRVGVQCHHWKQRQIGIKEVQEFLGALKAGQLERGIILTVGNYTAAALELSRQNQVEILDGAHLMSLCQRHGIQVSPQRKAA